MTEGRMTSTEIFSDGDSNDYSSSNSESKDNGSQSIEPPAKVPRNKYHSQKDDNVNKEGDNSMSFDSDILGTNMVSLEPPLTRRLLDNFIYLCG